MRNKGIVAVLAILVIVFAALTLLFNNFSLFPKSDVASNFVRYERMEDSNEVDDIEEDLNKTGMEDVDLEIADIESELDASLEN